VYYQVVPLSSSTKFAAVGIPCCVAGIAAGLIGRISGFKTERPLVGLLAGVVVWFIFVTIH
jgi:hypothetical protein